MEPEPIIVECGACGQPFAVAVEVFSAASSMELTVPSHPRLNGDQFDPPCDGGDVPATGKGPRRSWELAWKAAQHGKKPPLKLPLVLDGSGVRPRRIR